MTAMRPVSGTFGSNSCADVSIAYGDDDASNDDSGSGFEESDEGEDWDELEKKAEKADKNHRAVNGDESDDGKKKKRR
jgi:nucleosome binding factor SPN SPT16 subunit